MRLLLGYDIGSSSIKASLVEADSGRLLAGAASPEKELDIFAPQAGWAQQEPQSWWDNVISATNKIRAQVKFSASDVQAVGISYQMHGLVIVDKSSQVLMPAIIWCDSRAVQIGKQAAKTLGEKKCLGRLFNLPGNFTASKLKWVKENQPQIYSQIYKMMLPGDYIAMKMTGDIKTTPSGLSEAILWDFEKDGLADFVLDYYGISTELVPAIKPTFSIQGQLTSSAAEQLGLKSGTPVSYRAGDQPNNALSLGVLQPGQVAVTAGTSGVVYGVSDQKNYDRLSRVNVFLHVNHSAENPRYGVLLCLNGTGILNNWLKHNFAGDGLDYPQMNDLAAAAPVGSDGLVILPYGNGAERTLENRNIGASVHGWNFNIHKKAHFLRAAQEGIVFALNYGLDIMRDIVARASSPCRHGQDGRVTLKTVKAGCANMFLSPLFAGAFATVTNTTVELYNTEGSQGAARGAGIGAGIYKKPEEAFVGLEPVRTIEPNKKLYSHYEEAYNRWVNILKQQLKG